MAAFRAPIYLINLWLISYRHRYCTYLYYFKVPGPGKSYWTVESSMAHCYALRAGGIGEVQGDAVRPRLGSGGWVGRWMNNFIYYNYEILNKTWWNQRSKSYVLDRMCMFESQLLARTCPLDTSSTHCFRFLSGTFQHQTLCNASRRGGSKI